MKLIMAPHKVLLQRVEDGERRTESGLVLPNIGKSGLKKGVVISTGEGSDQKPMKLKKGDIVHYQYALEIKIDNKDYQVIGHDEYVFIERP